MKRCWLFVLAFLFTLWGCEKNEVSLEQSESNFIRGEVDREREKVSWATPIREDGVTKQDVVMPSMRIRGNFAAYRMGKTVYPYLPGFGSLNTESLPSEVLDLLDGFLATAAVPPPESRTIDTDFLHPDLEFLPHIMQYHFTSLHPVNRMIYGEPFVLEEGYQIPVRFLSDEMHTDTNIFVSSHELSYVIDQIQFGSAVENAAISD
ncbi:MAG: hypothetical protein IIW10_06425 [Spirochaetaceae bacterium]|nr:hypothetical protein [Spirochaetaceae bacterium]